MKFKPYTPIKCLEFPGFYEIPEFSGYAANPEGEIVCKKTKRVTKGGWVGHYLKVSLYRDGDRVSTMQYVHHLICATFYGPKQDPSWVVLHKDDNRRNNRKDNLSWGTQSENIQAVWDNNLRKRRFDKVISSEEIVYYA